MLAMVGRWSEIDAFAGAPLTERQVRSLGPWWKWLLAAVLVAMSLFHLYTGTFGILTARLQRATHLGFALGLAMVLFGGSPIGSLAGLLRFTVTLVLFPLSFIPRVRRAMRRANLRLGAWAERLKRDFGGRAWAGVGFALTVFASLVGVGCCIYQIVEYEALVTVRAGNPSTLDLWVAAVAILLVLEATRRSVSPALFFVTVAFLLYGIFGHHIPGDLGHKRHALSRILEFQFYSDQAIFGTPLAVSSTFVFLFVLFGAVLDRSGAGQYLIDLAFATMGRFRGGPAKAAVFASGTMGTINGSSIANTVTTGSLTIPLMKQAGFRPHVAGAVEVAASTNGQLVPPVMGAAAFIMAEFTGIAYGQIIISAAIPALLSYLAIFTMIHLNAVRNGIEPADRSTLPPVRRTLVRGLHLNLPVAAVLVFLLAGNPLEMARTGRLAPLTPLTSATWAIWVNIALFALVALFAAPTAYGLSTARARARGRARTGAAAGDDGHAADRLPAPDRAGHFGRQMLLALRDAAMNMVGIACACACCGIIIGVVAQTSLGPKITTIILESAADVEATAAAMLGWFGLSLDLSGLNMLAALVMTAAACILLGIGLPTTATYIIMSTLTAGALIEAAEAIGVGGGSAVSLLLAAHLFVFYYGILADDTPPVGLCAYAAAGIAGADPIRTGLTSFRFDLAAFMLPLIFFYNRELLLMDVTWLQVMWVLPGAIVAMLTFAAALEGHALRPLRWWARGLLLITAFLLIHPGPMQTGAGLGLLAVVLLLGQTRRPVTPREA